MQLQRFYLANPDDTQRLATDGTVQPAHQCSPQYFDSPESAYFHPAAANLTVHAVPVVETIPGAGVDADFATAGDTYSAIDPVMNPGIYAAVAAEVYAILNPA